MTIRKRIQLTLFIHEKDSEAIEKIRKEYNPEQYKLIKSHVTLCREDELQPIEKVIQNLSVLNHKAITIHFHQAIRFSESKGVLIPAASANEQFQKLREIILEGIINNPRKHEPHITLMHPRNSACNDIIFEQIQKITLPDTLTFRKISLIEQEERMPWVILKEFKLTEAG